MSDLAFNNYCIACDKLCTHTSIYCSEECKRSDEEQSVVDEHQSQLHHYGDECDDASLALPELVSPLLAPLLNYSSESPQMSGYTTSSDLDYFDLNYSVESKINYSSDLLSSIPFTSHNYRKWLTACL